MKYRWIFFLAIVAALALSVLVSGAEPKHNRYHQHLEAVEKEPCTDHDETVFCTHLPLMEVTTDGPVPPPFIGGATMEDRNYETVGASVRYFDSETKNNHLTDDPVVEERAQFRIRGATSRFVDKKNYLLKFVKEDMTSGLDVSLSGMTADSSWALHGPLRDKSLIRNYVCYNLAGEIMEYAPNVRFCEMFVNGEYMGVYVLTEKIGFNKNGRISITETDLKMGPTAYILRVDRGARDSLHELETFAWNSYITKPKEGVGGSTLEILYPSKTLTEGQRNYIATDFSRFEKALFSFDYNDPSKGWRQYIDVQSFIDFFLINEFTLNYDAPFLSTYLYKDIGGKLKMCVWDLDVSFDNTEYSAISPETYQMNNALWFKNLFKDRSFVDQVIRRYDILRKRFFNEEYLFQYIDDTVAYLGPAIERNYEKWGYSFDTTHDFLKPESRNVRNYEEAIQQIKNTITLRLDHMDNNLDRLYSLCHESMNKRYNYQAEAGGT